MSVASSTHVVLFTHIVLMIVAFTSFAFSFGTGLCFLLEENEIKHHRLTALMQHLPPLETIHKFHYKALTIGFVFLSVAMMLGLLMARLKTGHFFSGDAQQIGAFVTWGFYALLLNIRTRPGWRGRKAISLTLLGFLAVVFTFLALEHRV